MNTAGPARSPHTRFERGVIREGCPHHETEIHFRRGRDARSFGNVPIDQIGMFFSSS
jgi:hypothetical protein